MDSFILVPAAQARPNEGEKNCLDANRLEVQQGASAENAGITVSSTSMSTFPKSAVSYGLFLSLIEENVF